MRHVLSCIAFHYWKSRGEWGGSACDLSLGLAIAGWNRIVRKLVLFFGLKTHDIWSLVNRGWRNECHNQAWQAKASKPMLRWWEVFCFLIISDLESKLLKILFAEEEDGLFEDVFENGNIRLGDAEHEWIAGEKFSNLWLYLRCL